MLIDKDAEQLASYVHVMSDVLYAAVECDGYDHDPKHLALVLDLHEIISREVVKLLSKRGV